MSAQTKGVDVLAVMDAEILALPEMAALSAYKCDPSEAIKRLQDARAAVAELIEAAADFKNKGTFEAEERLDAALARCGGA